MPTWVGVVAALSLAIIALSAIGITVAAVMVARAGRSLLRTVDQFAGPALHDVRELVGTIKYEANALVGTSRDIRQRIVRAADTAEEKLSEIHALADLVQEEVEDTVIDAAVAMKRIRAGFSLVEWGRKALRKRRKRR